VYPGITNEQMDYIESVINKFMSNI
jgi:hypothetical protein